MSIARRALVALTLCLIPLAAACTPEQIAWWNDPTVPESTKEAVRAGLREQSLDAERRALQRHPWLTCIRRHESDRDGVPLHVRGYAVWNSAGSGANGAYQFLNSTWREASAKAGHPGYPSASSAPWWVQDAVAYHLGIVRGQKGHWAGSGC